MEDTANYFLNIGSHYPDLTSLVIGNLSGFVLTLALELYFMPEVTDLAQKRRQQGYTFLFCWVVSTGASALLWWAIDPKDRFGERLTVSLVVSVLGFFFYPLLARYLTAKFPAIGSAWNGAPK
jgi:hypothetical protein